MKRTIPTRPRSGVCCTLLLLPVVCLLSVSCADGVVAPDVESATVTEYASAARTTNPNANPSARVQAAPSSESACVDDASTVHLMSEPLPGDLCSIAELDTTVMVTGARIVSAFIDSAGGSLRIDDFEIVVPAGAVSITTRFSIKLPPANSNGASKRALAEFSPHNVAFAVPVTIRLPLEATNADADAPVTWWSPNGKQWVDQPTTATTDGRIEAQVDHFSYYGTRLRRGITIAGG